MVSATKPGQAASGAQRGPVGRAARRLSASSIALVALFGCGPGAAPVPDSGSARPGVTHMAVDRALDVGTQALLQRAIRNAEAKGDAALLIEIDTPGGAVVLMHRFARMIEEASREGLLTVAWVSGEATSAGALIALACERIYMRASATMGDSMPVTIGPRGIQAIPEEGGEREKHLAHARGRFRATAELRSRPPVLAEAMVDPDIEAFEISQDGERRIVSDLEWTNLQRERADVTLIGRVVPSGKLLNVTAREAIGFGLADGTAESVDEVLSRIGLSGAVPELMVRARSDELLAWLDAWAPLLIGLGLLLGWMEIKTPGFGLPGIAALVCFALLLVGRYLTGLADVPHLVLVVLGLSLIATELFLFPGTIWIGLVGGVLVIGGLLAVELGPGFSFSDDFDRALAFDAVWRLTLTAGATLVGAWMLSRFLPQVPVLNRIVQVPSLEGGAFAEALPEARDEHARSARPGERGRALTALRPVGKVALDVAPRLEYEARAEGLAVDAGAEVEVVSVSGGRLLVRASAPREPEGTGAA